MAFYSGAYFKQGRGLKKNVQNCRRAQVVPERKEKVDFPVDHSARARHRCCDALTP